MLLEKRVKQIIKENPYKKDPDINNWIEKTII